MGSVGPGQVNLSQTMTKTCLHYTLQSTCGPSSSLCVSVAEDTRLHGGVGLSQHSMRWRNGGEVEGRREPEKTVLDDMSCVVEERDGGN